MRRTSDATDRNIVTPYEVIPTFGTMKYRGWKTWNPSISSSYSTCLKRWRWLTLIGGKYGTGATTVTSHPPSRATCDMRSLMKTPWRGQMLFGNSVVKVRTLILRVARPACRARESIATGGRVVGRDMSTMPFLLSLRTSIATPFTGYPRLRLGRGIMPCVRESSNHISVQNCSPSCRGSSYRDLELADLETS